MNERAVRFGEGGYLVGVASRAEAAAHDGRRPAFVLVNAGLVHRVGPSRVHVELARALASRGFSSLRFDHGGVGGSGNRRDRSGFDEGGPREVVTAMDYASGELGCSSFVLVGLCSGARMALKVAAADPRVRGVVSVDGQRFPTWRFLLQRVRHKRRSLTSALWLRYRQSRATSLPPGAPPEVRWFPNASKEEVARSLQALVERGVHQCWIFTGTARAQYNYLHQHRDAFRQIRFGDLLFEQHMPQADHVLSTLEARDAVVGSITEWAERCWPAVAGGREGVDAA